MALLIIKQMLENFKNNIEDYVEGALKTIVEYAGYEYRGSHPQVMTMVIIIP